jgi:nitrous oxidase accessory protein NosD
MYAFRLKRGGALLTAVVAVLLGAVAFLPAPAGGQGPVCTFTIQGKTMTLDADCVVTSAVVIPDGFTLDGNGHTITGVDPAGSHFKGAVVRNGGAVAHVTNLTVTVAGLATVCDAGDDRLSGIRFHGASGSITDSRAINIRQGAAGDGCQEGDGIAVRNLPHLPGTRVRVADNVVSGYQKTGILVNGNVRVTVVDNEVTGLGPVAFIAQNGIQLGFGAQGTVTDNEVGGNWYTPATWTSTGILLFNVTGVRVVNNSSSNDQSGIAVIGNRNHVNNNEIGVSQWGIWLAGDNNRVAGNEVTCTDVGIDVSGNGNVVAGNEISGQSSAAPCDVGVWVFSGTGNNVVGNEFEHVTTPTKQGP